MINCLKHNNKKTVCPPGAMPLNDGLPNLIVPTLMRSGTHLLIDLILNNFDSYKGSPLYLDLDQYISEGRDINDIKPNSGMIIKTHFPQNDQHTQLRHIEHLLSHGGLAFSTTRDLKDIQKSYLKSFATKDDLHLTDDDIKRNLVKHEDFWGGKCDAIFEFESLVEGGENLKVVEQISRCVGVDKNQRFVPTLPKKKRFSVYYWKLITRLFGESSARVNTTIAFSKGE